MESNPFAELNALMRRIARETTRTAPCLATVKSISPLIIEVGGVDLPRELFLSCVGTEFESGDALYVAPMGHGELESDLYQSFIIVGKAVQL